MNPEVKAAWLEWLRDPNNKQGTGALRTNGENNTPRHCCLGGLCEVYRQQIGGGWNPTDNTFHDTEGRIGVGELPEGVIAWSGLHDDAGTFPEGPLDLPDYNHGEESRALHLIHLNDDHGWSFAQIADFIEENF